ncbi:hypothetical protein AM1_1716 [Acaryochloris marina MBIC11017]|uniref:Uncharacterized protein n=1 Tax=Acaryochloris marina (strain MBIC 11017) TaxID=329726 RepID=B0CB98_ACAM1|nr:hypothetical protein AM1_1716 [Acaryochloris marina MBIC11017]
MPIYLDGLAPQGLTQLTINDLSNLEHALEKTLKIKVILRDCP